MGKNKLYSKFNGAKAINHTRLRLGLSGLKAHRHAYNHIPHPNCDLCGARREDAMHFLLQCPVYTVPRMTLMNDTLNLYRLKHIVFDLTRTIVKKELVNYLLRGDKRLSDLENVSLFNIVQCFISASKRF